MSFKQWAAGWGFIVNTEISLSWRNEVQVYAARTLRAAWKQREKGSIKYSIYYLLNKAPLPLFQFFHRMLDQVIFASTPPTRPWWWSPSSAWTAPMGCYHGISWPPSTSPSSTHSWAWTWRDPTSPILPHHRLPASPPRRLPPAPSTKTTRTKAAGWAKLEIIRMTELNRHCR